MNNSENVIETLFEKAENYGKTTVELIKLNALDKTADIASSLVVKLIIVVVLIMFSFSINIGIALWLGDLLGKNYYGFFAVSSVYLIAILIIYICRNNCIKLPIQNGIIKQILQQKTI